MRRQLPNSRLDRLALGKLSAVALWGNSYGGALAGLRPAMTRACLPSSWSLRPGHECLSLGRKTDRLARPSRGVAAAAAGM